MGTLATSNALVESLGARRDELVVRVATDFGNIRMPADKGIVGESAQSRKLINVPDCYADARFNRAIDKETGYQSRCMLTIPLIGYEDSLKRARNSPWAP